MNIVDIILKKKNKQEISYEELKFLIDGYIEGSVKDYQVSAFLMAVVINGMTVTETVDLTRVMIESGDTIDLSSIQGNIVDKHSTGGVGDKTTLVLIPLVASCGVKVAKMSGRGLGHTGGTIDKLESIKGFNVNLKEKEFVNQINNIGCAIMSQTSDIAKADKLLYSLRDVTGTTESIPLIASSIMSKKIASGADFFVIDVKVGNGALMKNEEDATNLSNLMIEIGKKYNKKVVCVLTNMSEPLGLSIGNGLEVLESIETLKNNGPSDLKDLSIELASIMVSLSKNITASDAKNEVIKNLNNLNAYKKFEELVKSQNGDINNIDIAARNVSLRSNKKGIITEINAELLESISQKLGGGRISKEDKINYGVGIVLNKKVGDSVLVNEELARIYIDSIDLPISLILSAFKIEELVPIKKELIISIIE